MAHITRVKVDGLLGRVDPVVIELDRSTNIFFGENGCGKTTLLKILDSALSLDASLVAGLPFRKAEVSIFSINEGAVIKHSLEPSEKSARNAVNVARLLASSTPSEYSAGADEKMFLDAFRNGARADWKLAPKPKRTPQRWQHSFLPTTRLYSGEVLPRMGRAQISDLELDKLFNDAISKSWLKFYSVVLTSVREVQEEGLRKILEEVLAPRSELKIGNDGVDPVSAYKKARRFLQRQGNGESIGTAADFRKRYEDSEELRRVVGNIDEIESAIEKATAPVDQFLSTITSLFSRKKGLKLVNNELQVILESGDTLPLSGLSSGEKHIVKILLAVIGAGPSSVLIDEPELSMHIDWQRVLVKTLRAVNPNCQLIFASHSPEVMADVADSSIFRI